METNRYIHAQADLGTEKAERMLLDDALFITEGGASNPVALAGVLHEQLVYRARNRVAGQELKEDVSVRMVLSQLAFLVFGEDGNPSYFQDYQRLAAGPALQSV